jgi:hypothetical protein
MITTTVEDGTALPARDLPRIFSNHIPRICFGPFQVICRLIVRGGRNTLASTLHLLRRSS